MRVTLAYPMLGHPPDTTLELDDWVARRYIREGRVRVAAEGAAVAPPSPPRFDLVGWSPSELRTLRRMTVPALQRFAEQKSIDLGSAVRRKEILAVIEASSIPAG